MGIFSKEYLIEAGFGTKLGLKINIKDAKKMADDAIKSGDVQKMESVKKYIENEVYYKCEKGSPEQKQVDDIIDFLKEVEHE